MDWLFIRFFLVPALEPAELYRTDPESVKLLDRTDSAALSTSVSESKAAWWENMEELIYDSFKHFCQD